MFPVTAHPNPPLSSFFHKRLLSCSSLLFDSLTYFLAYALTCNSWNVLSPLSQHGGGALAGLTVHFRGCTAWFLSDQVSYDTRPKCYKEWLPTCEQIVKKCGVAAGAAALIAAQYPSLSMSNMKASMLGSVTPVAGLSGYCQTNVSFCSSSRNPKPMAHTLLRTNVKCDL